MKTPRAANFLLPRPSKFAKVVSGTGVVVSTSRVNSPSVHQLPVAELRETTALELGSALCCAEQVPTTAEDLADTQLQERQQQEKLSVKQEIRMELNKAAACAKRNLRLCEDRLAQAKACGVQFEDFGELLVEKGWSDELSAEIKKPYMSNLFEFVRQEGRGQVPVYPPPPRVFHAFNSCPFDKVKVVIIGQDPYHGPGQAMGLSFSVPEGVQIPSSLLNIYKEINQDLGCSVPKHGNLEKWAYQGVLLLNAVLTVREHHANSHSKKGWELFTDAAIRALSQKKKGVVFLLWGKFAQEKMRLVCFQVFAQFWLHKEMCLSQLCKQIDRYECSSRAKGRTSFRTVSSQGIFQLQVDAKHVQFPQSSSLCGPLRCTSWCRHFSKANSLLEESGILPIDWQI